MYTCSSIARVVPSVMDVAYMETGQAFVVVCCPQVETDEVHVLYTESGETRVVESCCSPGNCSNEVDKSSTKALSLLRPP